MNSPLYLALDVHTLGVGLDLLREVSPFLGGVKIGMEFFYTFGAKGYEEVGRLGLPIFLDLKLHDIPNTVGQGISALLMLTPRPSLITVHAAGGEEMLIAAASAAQGKCQLLGVTVLTSLAVHDKQESSTSELVIERARLCKKCGLDGVVASAFDVSEIKNQVGRDLFVAVAGIRPVGVSAHDQKRVATPEEAFEKGANLLVVGRAITHAENPKEMAKMILASLQESQGHFAHGRR